MFRKITSALLAVSLLLLCATTAFAAESTGFSDVSADAWYADAAVYCRDNGLMDGTGDGTFSPETPMTRAMLATVLYRMAGSPAAEISGDFRDVPADAWYAASVAWAAENGIVGGYGNGLFGPEDTVTREQTAAILWRYAGSPIVNAGEPFADASAIADYADAAVNWTRANGIIGGLPGNMFSPQAGTTRAQAAQILMRYDLLTKESPAEVGGDTDSSQGNTEESQTSQTSEASVTEQDNETEDSKILVAYFSATNNTEGVAQKLADGLDADLYEIVPEISYTSADLNYGSSSSRTSAEMDDPDARPAISGAVENMAQYDVVFVGYPIWWGEAPRIMSTFIESYDFSGKTIVPFCTSGSSAFGNSDVALRAAADGATWLDGHRFPAGASSEDIMAWANGLGVV